MSNLIDGQVDNASHDFDKIKQDGCEHGKEKKLNIDVDRILGLKGDDLVSVDSGDYGDIYGDYEPDAEVLTAKQVSNIYVTLYMIFNLIDERCSQFCFFGVRVEPENTGGNQGRGCECNCRKKIKHLYHICISNII